MINRRTKPRKKALWTQIKGMTKAPGQRRRIGMSKGMKSKLRVYAKLRREFLATHRQCAVFDFYEATDIHHTRGRVGNLLLATEHWIAVSRIGHQWIHDHPEKARQRGWLPPLGKWNCYA